MSDIAIKFENISKQYRLGLVGTGTVSHDLNRWWHKVRGKEDPYLMIGEVNDRSQKATSEYVWALKNITFDVKQGDVVGIIGRNGAGKSTLLKILSRVTSPTTGFIKAKGRIASLLEVGTGFHPELTGRENIYMNGAIMGMTKGEITRKLDEIIDFAGVEKYIDTPVKRYSSGMTVRLGFAIAAHLEPEILVVDEVLAVGDAEFQKKAIGKMQDVSRGEGRTVLFVSHNMQSVNKLCNNGILLENGYVKQSGIISDIVNSYIEGNAVGLNNRTARFQEDMTKSISITEVSITTTDKKENDILDITDKLKVKIKYITREDLQGTNVSFTISKDGIIIFRSWDSDLDQTLYQLRKAGKYETEILLPDFLNSGKYSLSVESGTIGVGPIQIFEDILLFEIESNIIDGFTKAYNRGGIVKAELEWKTSIINQTLNLTNLTDN